MQNNTEELFNKEITALIPLHYRFFSKMETDKVGELRTQIKFSTSSRHFSTAYINMPYHKPVSSIDTSKIFKPDEC